MAYTNTKSIAALHSTGIDIRLNMDPHFFTFQALQNQIDLGYDSPSVSIINGLREPWMVSLIYLGGQTWVGVGDFTSGGDYYSTVSGGRIVRWDLTEAEPQRIFDVGSDGGRVAVSPSGAKFVTGASSKPVIVDVTSGETRPVDATVTPEAWLAIDDSVGAATSATGEGTAVVVFDADSGATLKTSPAFSEILALRVFQGHVRALAIDSEEVLLVDVKTGSVLARQGLPASSELVIGALAPDGESFVLSNGGHLYIGEPGSFEPVGVGSRESVDVLSLTDSGLIVETTAADGVRVIDPALHAVLGQVCRQTVGTLSVSVSLNGQRVTCTNGYTTEVWDLDHIAPLLTEPPGATFSKGISATMAGTHAHLVRPGTLILEVSGRRDSIVLSEAAPMAGGNVTVVAVAPDGNGVLVGTDEGWVVAFDVQMDGSAFRVQQWRVPTGAPIEAAGWSGDPDSLAIRSHDRWWTPLSCRGCSDPRDSIALAIKRGPKCWANAQLVAFTSGFRNEMQMKACPSLTQTRN